MERKDWKGQWDFKKLGEVCELYQPQTISKQQLDDSAPYPVYGANGIIGRYSQFNHKEKELLMTCRGATCGTINISEAYSWINGNAMVIHPKSNCISIYFLRYLFNASDLSSIITGAAQPQITRSTLSNFPIPVPPLPVQARIVDELDCLQGILSKKRQQLAEYHSLAQAIFHQMFGDPVVNEKGWEVKRLGEVFDITSSKRIYQNELLLEGIPFYKVSDIVSLIDKNEVVPNSFISEYTYKDLVKNGNVPQANDLLITSRGTLGKCYIVKMNDKFYFQDGMVTWLRQKEEPILPTYVSYVFLENSFKSYLYKNAKHTTVDYISIQHLSKMLIPLPPLPLQQSFAARIAAIDSQRERLAASIRELETLLACRMETLLNCPQA